MENFRIHIAIFGLIFLSACLDDVKPDQPLEAEGKLAILISKEWRYKEIIINEFTSTNQADEVMEPLCTQGSLETIVTKRKVRYTDDLSYFLSWDPRGDYELGTEGDPNWQPRFGAFYLDEVNDLLIHNPQTNSEVIYSVQISEEEFVRTSTRYMSKNTACGNFAGNLVEFTEVFVAEEIIEETENEYFLAGEFNEYQPEKFIQTGSNTFQIDGIQISNSDRFIISDDNTDLYNGGCFWGRLGTTDPRIGLTAILEINCGDGFPDVQDAQFDNPSGQYEVTFNNQTYEISFEPVSDIEQFQITGDFNSNIPINMTGGTNDIWIIEGLCISNKDQLRIFSSITGCSWGGTIVELSGFLNENCSSVDLSIFDGPDGRYDVVFNSLNGSIEFQRRSIWIRGQFNGWDITAMQLIDDNTWFYGELTLNPDNDELKFADTDDWSGCDWGAPSSGSPNIGLSGTLDKKCGVLGNNADLDLGLSSETTFDVYFNDCTQEFSFEVPTGIYLAGFFNDWGNATDFPLQNMGNGIWQSFSPIIIDSDGLLFMDHPDIASANCVWRAAGGNVVGYSGILEENCPNNGVFNEFYIDVNNEMEPGCCFYTVTFNQNTGEFSFTR